MDFIVFQMKVIFRINPSQISDNEYLYKVIVPGGCNYHLGIKLP